MYSCVKNSTVIKKDYKEKAISDSYGTYGINFDPMCQEEVQDNEWIKANWTKKLDQCRTKAFIFNIHINIENTYRDECLFNLRETLEISMGRDGSNIYKTVMICFPGWMRQINNQALKWFFSLI